MSAAASLRTVDRVEDAGLDPARWRTVLDLFRRHHADGKMSAAAMTVIRGNVATPVAAVGRRLVAAASPPIGPDAIFLVASITKPVVAAAVLLLAERGLIALNERVTTYIPEFGGRNKYGTTLRQLLTHASGLPDMLPNNRALRRSHAPLAAFVEATCAIAPDFQPGHGVQYQSTGFALLGEIVARVTGTSCATFLRDEVFRPLGMTDSALGAPPEWYEGANPKADRCVEVQLPPDQEHGAEDWGWNSRYWRTLGAPWGGLQTTAADLARFAASWLPADVPDVPRLLSPATIAVASGNRLEGQPDVPEADRRCRPWGLGWRMNWPGHPAVFCDLLGPTTFGHWGATGTVLWIDPERKTAAVILTTLPLEPHGSIVTKLSNAIVAACL